MILLKIKTFLADSKPRLNESFGQATKNTDLYFYPNSCLTSFFFNYSYFLKEGQLVRHEFRDKTN